MVSTKGFSNNLLSDVLGLVLHAHHLIHKSIHITNFHRPPIFARERDEPLTLTNLEGRKGFRGLPPLININQ